MKTVLLRLGGYLGAATCGALLLMAFAWPDEPIVYREVVVPARAIEVREAPARPPTVIERIRFVSVQPVQIATAPGGAQGDVATFCRPTLLATTDTVYIEPDPVLLLRSVGFSEARAPWSRDRVFVAGPTSTGDLRALDYRTRGSWDARTSGDSVLVRYGRTAAVGDWAHFLFTAYGAISLVGDLIR